MSAKCLQAKQPERVMPARTNRAFSQPAAAVPSAAHTATKTQQLVPSSVAAVLDIATDFEALVKVRESSISVTTKRAGRAKTMAGIIIVKCIT
jgi:hypothetical protein